MLSLPVVTESRAIMRRCVPLCRRKRRYYSSVSILQKLRSSCYRDLAKAHPLVIASEGIYSILQKLRSACYRDYAKARSSLSSQAKA